MRDFTQLVVWQKSFDMAVELERALQSRTARGIPGLRSQALRAAAAVSANIAEGCGKESVLELLRYLDIAAASNKELLNHMLMAREVGILDHTACAHLEAKRDEVAKMLFSYRRAIQSRYSSTAGARDVRPGRDPAT